MLEKSKYTKEKYEKDVKAFEKKNGKQTAYIINGKKIKKPIKK